MKRLVLSLKRRPLTWIGMGITAVYLAVFISTPIFGINNIVSLTLNELGDFLAGTFAPLALIWLVIGYFQHGQELRLNTEALKAQQEELRRQVEETAILAKSAERQAKANEELVTLNRTEQQREIEGRVAEAQPMFVGYGGSSGREFTQGILNQGADITDVEIRCPNHPKLVDKLFRYTLWKRDDSRKLGFGPGLRHTDFPITISISYSDNLATRNNKKFKISADHELKPIEQGSETSALNNVLSDES